MLEERTAVHVFPLHPSLSSRAQIEPLESRFAPAVLFLSGAASGSSSLQILDASGNDAQDSPQEIAAKTTTHATAVVLLKAGDELIFDRNGNHLFDRGDLRLAEVTGGQGLFFFTDGPTGRRAHAFELTELTGIAASDGFAANIHTDLHGSIVTALDADGFLTASGESITITGSSIAHLSIDGQIARRAAGAAKTFGGHLVAGGNLSDITIGGPLYTNGPRISVAGLFGTGTATNNAPISFDAGEHTFRAEFTPLPGANGGSIDHVTLSHGLGFGSMMTGNGGPSAPGVPGGDGGSIRHVSFGVVRTPQFSIQAGSGIYTDNEPGDGGEISNVSATMRPSYKGIVTIASGGGGSSNPGTSGAGGDGGDIEHLSLYAPAPLYRLTILGGPAGNPGTGLGFSGAGGDLSDLQIRVDRLFSGYQSLQIEAGSVYSTSAGVGGSIDHLVLTVDGPILGHALIKAGNGAGGNEQYGQSTYAGIGGSITNSSVALNASVGSDAGNNERLYGILAIRAGHGEEGGDIENIALLNRANPYAVELAAGHGRAGSGGDLRAVHVVDRAEHSSGLRLAAGGGRSGGDATGISIHKLRGTLYGFSVEGGFGSEQAGDVEGLSIQSDASILAGYITGGRSGIHAGDVSNVSVQGPGRIGSPRFPFSIQPGSLTEAGSAYPPETAGSLANLAFDAPLSYFQLGGDIYTYENRLTGATGAPGANISHVSGIVGGVSIVAGPGGEARNGTGGPGGSVSDVTLKITENFAHRIVAGDGGDGLTGGIGGSVSDVRIQGDIGDFTKPFGVRPFRSFQLMGGLAAGAAGASTGPVAALTGSIDHVSAGRIAAIVAGQPFRELTAANAVESIAYLSASVIGADTQLRGPHRAAAPGGRFFDFSGGADNTFTLGEDFPIDGLVVVKAGGLLTPFPVAPLMVVYV